ncbi:MAG: YggS family pyridoxal phosphate-dependent enzyme [Dehalococcoidia bacterium]|nr:YggS family pyridoxal phosphate-dependent enzyme [Dehalococcoidia bacterium]
MTPDGAVIAGRIAAVRARIDAACQRSGREPREVTLIGVTKTHDAATVAAAYHAGLRDFGENRVQEALPKIDALSRLAPAPVWHFIGRLQTNKAPAAADAFDILHTVDSLRLAEAISRHAEHQVRVLIEVNVAGESTKAGVEPHEVGGLAAAIAALPDLELVGLMTVAPRADNPEDVRAVFRELRGLRDAIGLAHLSMGMTDDFEVAVEEGATLVRVGRAMFGARPPVAVRSQGEQT